MRGGSRPPAAPTRFSACLCAPPPHDPLPRAPARRRRVTRFPVAVLISGEGSNLQALLDTVHRREGIEIVAVGASRADARGLERARRAGVETRVFALTEHS